MIETPRLNLIPLTLVQLETSINSPAELAAQLGFPLAKDLFAGVATRAVRMKIEKMKNADPVFHPWFTYWLIVIQKEQLGAGLVGFKGIPDSQGAVEIGYGIDESQRGKGYMSEAVHALIQWAFEKPGCQAVTATGVLRNNIASQRVLMHCGFELAGGTPEGLNFKLKNIKTSDL